LVNITVVLIKNELNRGFSTINRIAKHPADGSIKKIEGFEVITPLRKNN